ncbi:MAG: branched-chain amino acid ABC transporter permease [Bacteroidetes bacterium]|nr:branched-chain amino acid ABC transporter permease [Bacteroidota bacterium]
MKSKVYFIATILVLFLVNLIKDSIDPYYYTILIYIGINIILASSLNLINGFTGQFSLGHAGFMAIGGYLSIALATYFGPFFQSTFGTGDFGQNMTFVILMIISGIAAALVGLLVGVPSLRLKGDYLAIVTLGFSEIIRVLIQGMDVIGASQGYRGVYIYDNGVKSLQMIEGAQNGFMFYGVPKYTNFFWVFFIAAFLIYFIYNLINSTYGRGFIAVKDDEVAAESMGINTTKFKVTAFVSGAFFAGIAGSLYGHFNLYLNPEDFNFLKSVEIVVMVILGGMGSIPGVIIAAAILTILPEMLRGISEYRMVVYALLLIIIMLTRPQGLFGVKLNVSKKKKKEKEIARTGDK